MALDFAKTRGTPGQLVKIIGDKELIKAMREVRTNIQRRVMRPAINFGLTPISRAAKANAPKETGLLKKAIKKKVGKRGSWGKIFVDPKVEGEENGKKRKPAKYAHLLEFGTEHAQAKPFMRPAVEGNKSAAFSRIASKAKEGLAKVAAKARKN